MIRVTTCPECGIFVEAAGHKYGPLTYHYAADGDGVAFFCGETRIGFERESGKADITFPAEADVPAGVQAVAAVALVSFMQADRSADYTYDQSIASMYAKLREFEAATHG